MVIEWAGCYRSEWDEQPERYLQAGVVNCGRSRRLAKARDDHLHVKAYIGVQHDDPARWNLRGDPVTRFFLSLFIHGQTISLRTYPTIGATLAALASFQDALRAHLER